MDEFPISNRNNLVHIIMQSFDYKATEKYKRHLYIVCTLEMIGILCLDQIHTLLICQLVGVMGQSKIAV